MGRNHWTGLTNVSVFRLRNLDGCVTPVVLCKQKIVRPHLPRQQSHANPPVSYPLRPFQARLLRRVIFSLMAAISSVMWSYTFWTSRV